MIPCKNCLILAICRSKKSVKCSLLHNWAIRLQGGVGWRDIREYLPHVISVIHDKPSIVNYTLHSWDLLQEGVERGRYYDNSL